jgi:hypothetical protein
MAAHPPSFYGQPAQSAAAGADRPVAAAGRRRRRARAPSGRAEASGNRESDQRTRESELQVERIKRSGAAVQEPATSPPISPRQQGDLKPTSSSCAIKAGPGASGPRGSGQPADRQVPRRGDGEDRRRPRAGGPVRRQYRGDRGQCAGRRGEVGRRAKREKKRDRLRHARQRGGEQHPHRRGSTGRRAPDAHRRGGTARTRDRRAAAPGTAKAAS